MYLITIEGGDGSGKGLAATVVGEVLAKERGFNSVELTAEPEDDILSEGQLLTQSVRKNTPLNMKPSSSL